MSETDKKFCNSYFLVDPTKASVLDLLFSLFPPKMTSATFIDCPPDTLKSVRRSFTSRWILALVVLLQKVLMFIRKPFAFIGDFLTYWLNLLMENGGSFKLIVHLLTGKLVKPEKSSATYKSFIGCSDRRIDLDEKINVGTIECKSMLSIMASKIAYENKHFINSVVKNNWKMDFVGFYDFYNAYQEKNLTQAFMFKTLNTDPNLIVISFRGTEAFNADDWCNDLDVSCLGGAIAALFPAVLAIHGENKLLDKLEGVYTFGQPRVGDEDFAEFMNGVVKKHGIEYERFVYNNDIVPRVPFDDKILSSYKHYGSCNYFNSLYQGKVN